MGWYKIVVSFWSFDIHVDSIFNHLIIKFFSDEP